MKRTAKEMQNHAIPGGSVGFGIALFVLCEICRKSIAKTEIMCYYL